MLLLPNYRVAHGRWNPWRLLDISSIKERKEDLYGAYPQYKSTTKRSDVDHTELPANTPHLPFLRISIR